MCACVRAGGYVGGCVGGCEQHELLWAICGRGRDNFYTLEEAIFTQWERQFWETIFFFAENNMAE